MSGTAKQFVDQSRSNVQTALGSLQQALNSVEKQDNRNIIQQAINTLNSVNQNLSGYRD
ncbi:MAG: hypothetical protein ACOZCL_04040 [Bacillota bacterium]